MTSVSSFIESDNSIPTAEELDRFSADGISSRMKILEGKTELCLIVAAKEYREEGLPSSAYITGTTYHRFLILQNRISRVYEICAKLKPAIKEVSRHSLNYCISAKSESTRIAFKKQIDSFNLILKEFEEVEKYEKDCRAEWEDIWRDARSLKEAIAWCDSHHRIASTSVHVAT